MIAVSYIKFLTGRMEYSCVVHEYRDLSVRRVLTLFRRNSFLCATCGARVNDALWVGVPTPRCIRAYPYVLSHP
jgi:hypothetical protein